MNPITLNPVSSLQSSRTELSKNLQKQEAKVVKAAEDVQKAFSRSQDVVNAEAEAADTAPVEDTIAVSTQAAVVEDVIQQNEDSVVEPIMDMKQAEMSYLASLKALDAVNDLEKETVDILK